LKVFQIGFNRSGTTSLYNLFKNCGYKSVHYEKGKIALTIKNNIMKRLLNTNNAKEVKILEGMEDFVFYSDMEFLNTPIRNKKHPFYAYTYFKDLYQDYPNSKFIFNYRPFDEWVNSRISFKEFYVKDFKRNTDLTEEEDIINLWKEHYENHTKNVIEFFKDKPDKLLTFDISKDDPKKIIEFFTELKLDINNWGKYNANKNHKKD
jgi:hypothetical protein